jgi:hypothetical protein
MRYKSPLLQSLQSNLRLQHLSRRTEAAYVYWTKRFIRFSGLRHPSELGASDVRQFLSHLVVDRKLSAATQQQALSALLFLYRHVVGLALEELGRLPRGRVPTTLPPNKLRTRATSSGVITTGSAGASMIACS